MALRAFSGAQMFVAAPLGRRRRRNDKRARRVASRLVARLALLAGRAPRLRAPHRSAGGRKYESGLVCARLNETKYRISAPNERMYERLKPIALEQFGAAQMVRA